VRSVRLALHRASQVPESDGCVAGRCRGRTCGTPAEADCCPVTRRVCSGYGTATPPARPISAGFGSIGRNGLCARFTGRSATVPVSRSTDGSANPERDLCLPAADDGQRVSAGVDACADSLRIRRIMAT
jgi:hypothetical protein